jgi:prepilin peptidase CpaA
MSIDTLTQTAALLITAIAAVTDWRRGVIPNWLTLPIVAVAPIVHWIAGGPWAGAASLGGMLICALVPYMLYRRDAGGGGDVKLFAAIGALVSLSVGIEIQLLTFIGAALVSLGRLAWRGRLLRTLSNTLFLAVNPILPRRWRREVVPELMTAVRLGAFIFAGTVCAVALHHPEMWP